MVLPCIHFIGGLEKFLHTNFSKPELNDMPTHGNKKKKKKKKK